MKVEATRKALSLSELEVVDHNVNVGVETFKSVGKDG